MSILDGPKTPSIVQLIQWIADPIGFMESNAKRYGNIFKTQLGKKLPLVFISDTQAIKQIFNADFNVFDVERSSGFTQTLMGENSVMVLEGHSHKQRRKLLMPPFHGSRMRTYGQLICDITKDVIDRWPIGEPFCFRSSTQEITMRVISRAVFGLNESSRSQKLNQALANWLDLIGSSLKLSLLLFPILQKDLGSWSPWTRFLRCKQTIDELLYAEIRERRSNLDQSRTDIMTLLLSARDENGQPMTDEELRDELITLLVSGHETTATALSWALYWIHKLPEVKHKLLEELHNCENCFDVINLSRLPYLNAVCQEVLRIYPVALVAFPRVTKYPIEFMGYQIEAGTMLTPCIYLTHHREDIYPEPKTFRPERFLEHQYSPYEYLPFGGGNRRCIGIAMAQYEMKLAIATILLNLDLELPKNLHVRPVRRSVTFAPSDNLQLVVTARRTPNQTPATAAVG